MIDELDTKIHPILLKYIMNMFPDLSVNKNHAQLIFTSHDLSTMSSVRCSEEMKFGLWQKGMGKTQSFICL